MLAQELSHNNLPQLQLSDSVFNALQLMNDFKLTHLPVVSEDKYLGLLGEDELLNLNDETKIEVLQENLIKASVSSLHHFLNAINFSVRYHTNVVPIVNEQMEYLGSISGGELLSAISNFSGANEPGAVVVLELEHNRFSISEISRIVESDGAMILHLNIVTKPDSSILQVTIHLNKREISVIVAAFERYEYSVSYYSGEELFVNEIDNNYRHLMNYLDI